MITEHTGLTWIGAALERAERAASKLRWLQERPRSVHAEDMLLEAADELRAAAEHCADSVYSLRRERAD